ncbi:MAG: tripartite tricarboxylate transporter substrate-binding protein, partial [Burkholderiaceae bacterium]
ATPVCLVPAKPGGGMDLTCKLLQAAAPALPPLRSAYLPGGIGAVAWTSIVSQRSSNPDQLVVFSGGSLLNLAQGKYGKASPADVRWVAAVGTDYGMIAVRQDAPYRNLRQLLEAIRQEPAKVTIGVSGTIGSQDWLKMALLARRDGIDPKKLRFVALEGGGEAFTALLAGHVQVASGDASEAAQHGGDNRIRVLAVLAEARLPGPLATVPTAREQGYDVVWPIVRGVYMGPGVADAAYRDWVERFDRALATPEFDRLRAAQGLYPFALTGAALAEYVNKTVDAYGRLSREWDLIR